MNHKKQSGFLALITVFIITLFTVLSAGLTYLFISRATSTGHLVSSNHSFSLATSGIEQGRYVLNDTTLANRSNCASLSQNISLANSAAAVTGSFVNQTTSIVGNLTRNATTLTLADTSALSATGRIYIDREAIDYKNNDTATNQLSDLYRGQAGTLASSHTNGTISSQFQCYLQSIGSSPSTDSYGRSTLNMANQSQSVVAVGEGERLMQWNHPNNESNWQAMSGSNANVQFNSVDLLNAHQGFAVGNTSGGTFVINQLSEGTWRSNTFTLSGITSQNLNGVSAVSSQDAFAVGNLDGTTTLLLQWNGSSWSNHANTGTDSNLNAVQVLDTSGDEIGDFGFAVGGTSGSSGSSCATDFYQCFAATADLATCQNYITTESCYTVTKSNGNCSKTNNRKDYAKCIDDNKADKCQKYIEKCTKGNGADSIDVCANNYYVCQSADDPEDYLSECQSYVSNSGCYTVIKTNGKCDITKSSKNYRKCIEDDDADKCVDYMDDCTENKINGSGGGGSSEGSILIYDGTDWADSTINGASNVLSLKGLSVVPNGSLTPTDAFAVGESSTNTGVILRWNGTDWDILGSPRPSEIMRAISMIDTNGDGTADYGWAVGDNGNAYQFSGGLWSSVQIIAGGNDLFGVKVLSPSDAWVVGANGTRYHWNGSRWTQTEDGVNTSDALRSISVAYAQSSPSSGWQEVIN